MKRYLWIAALLMSVSGSADASKGGNLASRGLTSLKHKFGTTVVAGVLLGQVFCGGITGCSNGDSLVGAPTESENAQVTETKVQLIDIFDGERVYFELGGNDYEGRVVEGVSANEVLVSLTDGSEVVINVDRIAGTLIAGHPDIGTEVIMLGERGNESVLLGKIIAVYGDIRKIKLVSVVFVDGEKMERLDTPRIRFVHKDTDIHDSGYLTREEFHRRLNNGEL